MEAIDLLKEEHRIIEFVLGALDRAVAAMKHAGGPEPHFFIETASFIRNFTDLQHHRKEEEALFKMMVASGLGDNDELLAAMIREHGQSRILIREMLTAADRLVSGDGVARQDLQESVHGITTLARRHIETENTIVFPLAERIIPQSRRGEIVAAFERIERQNEGTRIHGKCGMLATKLDRASEAPRRSPFAWARGKKRGADAAGRRAFMKKLFMMGAGGMLLLANGPVNGRAETQTEAPADDKEKAFSREWIMAAVACLEAQLPAEKAIGVLEECGRACARKGAVKMAIECAGDLDKLLAGLRGWIGASNVRRTGNTITLVYTKCYCPNVRDVDAVPAAYCNCSRGWVREMFETVTGKPCDVALLSSIKRGDPECVFTVRV